MEIMTSWKEEGLHQGAGDLALRLLRRRFGPLPEALEARIMDLPTAQVGEFGEALLDFATLEDANAWLIHHG